MSTFYASNAPREQRGNFIEIRVMDVSKTGVYTLDGNRSDYFSSNAFFGLRLRPDEEPTVYANDPRRRPFVVSIEEIKFEPYSAIPGMKGRFAGVLYNEQNPTDSIVITDGVFRFKKLGADHCGYE